MTAYKFIDGAYFERCLADFGEEWLGATPDFDPSAVQGDAQKVFYYDALPIQRKLEADADFELRRQAKIAFFARLKTVRGWHVINGIAKRNRGQEAQQKEVDVLLAVDMLTHAHRRNMTHVSFIAGDLDFRPLVDAVVREGVFVTLEYDPKHSASDLIDTSDARKPWDYWTMAPLLSVDFRNTYPMVSRYVTGPNDVRQHSNILQRGIWSGHCVAELMQSLRSQQFYIVATEVSEATKSTGGHRMHMSHPNDRELLKKLWNTYVEEANWS